MKKQLKLNFEKTYHLPLFELIEQAHKILKENFPDTEVQKCSLLSIKTGNCPENCSYCPQSAHFKTAVEKESLIDLSKVKNSILKAKQLGAKRFCMGAAWREVRDGEQFNLVLEMIKEIKKNDMEACVTLGMLTEDQAVRLKQAGLDAYNHNLDSGPDFYPKIISTRNYNDRLKTLKNVQKAGLSTCSGGIIGMGESISDRLDMLVELASLDKEPESIPINLLIKVTGTPLADLPDIEPIELVRYVATTRTHFPRSRVRLSAGRKNLSKESQLLCYYAGANSIFFGEKLLTMENPSVEEDLELINEL